MSNKNKLKDKIKKPTAVQTFFNQYEDTKSNKDNNSGIDNKNDDVITDNNHEINVNVYDKTYIKDDSKNNYDYDSNNNSNDDNKVENNDSNNCDNNNDGNDENNNENVNTVDVDDEEYLRALATGKKTRKKKTKKVFTSFYMDHDLAVAIEKMLKNGEKGDKSKLINLAIRKLLREYGVIE